MDIKIMQNLVWQEPTMAQTGAIGITLSQNGVRGCGEFHIKEITSNEFLVACTSDGENWKYYGVYPNIKEVVILDNEIKEKLTPPR